MRKYLRVLGLFWTTAVAAEMEYRVNFLLASITSLGNLAGSIFSLFLFYRPGYRLGGWTWHEALLVMALFTIFEGVAGTWLRPNLSRIVSLVQRGTLDFVLLKPIDAQFWLSTRNFSPWGLPDIAFGSFILVYAGTKLGFGPWQYALGLLPLACGLIMLYSVWFILGATSIWFVKVYNATEVLRGLLAAGRFPVVAYPAAYRFFFTFIVPVAFLTTVPAQAMLGRAKLTGLGLAIVLAAVLLVAARSFWRFALRFYTSASS